MSARKAERGGALTTSPLPLLFLRTRCPLLMERSILSTTHGTRRRGTCLRRDSFVYNPVGSSLHNCEQTFQLVEGFSDAASLPARPLLVAALAMIAIVRSAGSAEQTCAVRATRRRRVGDSAPRADRRAAAAAADSEFVMTQLPILILFMIFVDAARVIVVAESTVMSVIESIRVISSHAVV